MQISRRLFIVGSTAGAVNLVIHFPAQAESPESIQRDTFVGTLLLTDDDLGQCVDDTANGSEFRLAAPFGYIDRRGRRWDVPKGACVNGASIPRGLWPVVGSPWGNTYRRAAVVHDYHCVAKTRAWEDVHETFYFAMLREGLRSSLAKAMYYAVYHFGPRWPDPNSGLSNNMFEHLPAQYDSVDLAAKVRGINFSKLQLDDIRSLK